MRNEPAIARTSPTRSGPSSATRPAPTDTAMTLEATNATAAPAHVGTVGWRDARAITAKLVRSNSSNPPTTAKTMRKPPSSPRSTKTVPGSPEMMEEVVHAPLAEHADEDHGATLGDLEFALDGFGLVGDAVQVRAPEHPDDPLGQVDRSLFADLELADDRDRRRGGDERDRVHLPGRQLHVLHLDDVLPPEFARADVQRHAHGRVLVEGLDPDDAQDLEGKAVRDVVDDRPVLDRGDLELPHGALSSLLRLRARQECFEERHSDGDGQERLSEVRGVRGRVDLGRDLAGPGQWVQHDHAGLRPGEHAVVDPVGPGDLEILSLVREPLLLDPRDVEHVRIPDGPRQLAFLLDLDAHVVEQVPDLLGESKGGRGREDELRSEEREGIRERMDRSSVLQVPEEDHAKAGEGPERLLHRREVKERLGRVLTGAIPCVDDRSVGGAGREPGRPLVRMAKYDRIGVPAHHSDRVGEALPLADRTDGRVGDRDALTAEA